ncbi:unnamed protein product [Lymnaea stagnalis]|uniref:Mesoderm induction early response protein 1 n=1 Tax=Lymnaea stagnalis TaxID=6523 RepID=A0AAV2HRD0_LYMST
MMVHDYDDERTLDEEEAMTSGESCTGELDDLQKESEMPIEDLLAQYAAGPAGSEELADNSQSTSSSSEEEAFDGHSLRFEKEIHSQHAINNGTGSDERDINPHESVHNVSRSQTGRLLRSTSHPESDESGSSSDDENYEPIEEHKKTIQVGSDFQAVIPSGLSAYGDAPAYENEDRLLWDPSKIKDEAALNDYLCNVQREVDRKLHTVASIPRGKHIRDDEQALFLLLQCDNNIEEAERRRKMQAVPPTDVMSLWSEDECRNFEDGLRLYGKNFHEIHHNKVRTRSVFELVHFYYLWKKTERHDIFAAKTRAEKRKYSLNPGVTDHMDRFLEEQEVELHQIMAPQPSDSKVDMSDDDPTRSNMGLFNTGKTTIMSPSRHLDRGLVKGEHLGPSKRIHHLHHHGDIYGNNCRTENPTDHLSPKKLKLDNFILDQQSPKKQKLLDLGQESLGTSPKQPSSLTNPLLTDKNLSVPECEQGNQPKHIENNTSAFCMVAGATDTDIGSGIRTDGAIDKLTSSEISFSPVTSCKSPSLTQVSANVNKPVSSAGDTAGPDLAYKSVTSESAVQ